LNENNSLNLTVLKKYFLLAIFIGLTATAQKKYQSLLWEISGNGLTKNSYVYGSMHVSEKVSYHLSDNFFQHLLAADYVANESDPASWNDLYDLFNGQRNYNYNKFYRDFYLTPVTKNHLYQLFVSNNYNINNLLFRTTEYRKDYQEDTYLDMFIYQTGKKYNKKTVGLEDAKKSMAMIMNINPYDNYPKEDNTQAILKLLRGKSLEESLMDFYRDKDLDMMDSLLSLTSSKGYLDVMINKRNVIMVHSIDSIAKKGSLFAAIGAAHLPGKKGVIELLREKGYTVNPILGPYTEKGKKNKKQIDEYFTKPLFEIKSTDDGMVQLPMNNQIIYSENNLNSPDLTNGGVINVKRILRNDFLNKNKTFNHTAIDSMLYENIPGEIIDKKFFKEHNYTGYDIKNITKSGNTQHYKFYITPLEVIGISMAGTGNYVRQFENEVFNNIKLKQYKSGWEKITPNKGGFTIEIPVYNSVYGNRKNPTTSTDIQIYAYNEGNDSNYFVIEKTQLESNYLEKTAYELKRIQEEFYLQYEAQANIEEKETTKDSYESTSKIGNKTIALKSIIEGDKYYLLGTVQATPEETKRFFNSFKLLPFHAFETPSTFKDSTAMFSINIPRKQNEIYFLKNKPSKSTSRKGNKKINVFTSNSDNFFFQSENGNKVALSTYQYHKYQSEKSIDSIYASIRKDISKNFEYSDYDEYAEDIDLDDYDSAVVEAVVDSVMSYGDSNSLSANASYISTWNKELGLDKKIKENKNNLIITKENKSHNESKKYYTHEALVTSNTSNQAIKYKTVFKDGLSYQLSALVDKNYQNNNAFIENAFHSFEPFDTILNYSVFDKKLKLFIEDARSEHDSIRYSALNSLDYLTLSKDDLTDLQLFIDTFNFKAEETDALNKLYQKIGKIKDPSIIPFLEKNYKKENSNASTQIQILKALSYQKSKVAYKKIQELMNYDLPVSDNDYDITSLFNLFTVDTKNSAVLFPDIFQLYSIKEYHNPVVIFTTKLIEDNLVNAKNLKSYKKMLLTNAKLEYKRVYSWKSRKDAKNNEYYYGNNSNEAVSDLLNYIQLVYPFKKEKDFEQLFNKIKALKIEEIDLELARTELVKNNTISKDFQEELLQNPKTQFQLYQMLADHKLIVKSDDISDEQLALSGIIYFQNIDPKKQALELLEKKTVPFENKEVTFYFFKQTKIEEEDSYNYNNTSRLQSIAFVNDKNTINTKAYKTFKRFTIIDEDKIEDLYQEVIDRAFNDTYSRASFGKIDKNDPYGYGYEYNMDYDDY
jgi:uncharacterized protein YbaP (TraB family)